MKRFKTPYWFKRYLVIRRNDPIKCNVFRDLGCSHCDGMLCDYSTCKLRKEWDNVRNDYCRYLNIVKCPICGGYVSNKFVQFNFKCGKCDEKFSL